MQDQKACTVCKATKPLDDFYGDKRAPDGRKSACKTCHAAQYVRSRKKNPAPYRAAARRWKTTHPDEAAASQRRTYVKHGHKYRARWRAWAKANRGLINEISAPAKRAYKARKKGAEGHHTKADVERIQRLQRGRCAICRTKLNKFHVDHVVALRNGGSNWPRNLQLLCPTCNCAKRHSDPMTFMRDQHARLL